MYRPEVSVVIPVFNEGSALESSLHGVLAQDFTNFEIIVVDDGSNDESREFLNRYGNEDARVRVVRQKNKGITRALIHGCCVASGTYIARHDVGDRSTQDRIGKQVEILSRYSDVAIVSSWVRYQGPDGEPAGGVRHDPWKADEDLRILGPAQCRVRGPFHGSTMFRKKDYEAVGGYRKEFYFAQDIDLWLRLHERGRHYLIPEDLYSARLAPDSISGRHRSEQDHCLELAVSAAWARKAGETEVPYLREAAGVRPLDGGDDVRTRRLQAGSLYSMGCKLLVESPGSASKYFVASVKAYPFNIKAWLRIAESTWLSHRHLNR